MFYPIAIAVLSVLTGALLGLLPGTSARTLGPIHTFALTASLAVIGGHLLPEALQAVGAWALLAFAAAAIAPTALYSLVEFAGMKNERHARPDSVFALELGYAGLLVHQVTDGLSLAAYTGPLGKNHSHLDVIVALGAHTIPIVAMVVLGLTSAYGRRVAMSRAGWLAVASVVGILAASLVDDAAMRHASAWIAAAAAGLLLHVVTHDTPARLSPNFTTRAVDFLAAMAGVVVGLAGDVPHHSMSHGEQVHHRFYDAFWQLTLDTAPLLLVGLSLGAMLHGFGSRMPKSWFASHGPLRDAFQGALLGLPLRLCAGNLLKVSRTLHAREIAPAFLVAFLISTPELGVETWLLSVRFLGWPFASIRLCAVVLVAVVAALVIARLAGRPEHPKPAFDLPELCEERKGEAARSSRRLLGSFDELLGHLGAWMMLGLLAAACIEAFTPMEALSKIHPTLQILVITLVMLPSYVCAPAAVPIAAILIAKGLSPGGVLVALLLGSSMNLRMLDFLRKAYGLRATLGLVGAVIAIAWGLAATVNYWLPVVDVHAPAGMVDHDHGFLTYAASLLLAGLLLRSIWVRGMSAWLAPVWRLRSHDRV